MSSQQDDLFISGKKIYLRSYQPGDEVMIARLENHPDPRATLFYALPTTVEQQRQKMERLLADPGAIVLTICAKESGEAVGQTSLLRIDWIGRMAIFYIGIADKSNWSKGYGSEATQLMLEYAFDTLNLNRVQLHVAVENEAAVSVYKRCGFSIEGTLREAMYHRGRHCDFYVMGVLRREWEEKPSNG